jgi:hypothetical protein
MSNLLSRTDLGSSSFAWLASLLVLGLAASCAPALVQPREEGEPELSPEQADAIRDAAKADGLGCLLPFQSVYINLGLAGKSEQGDVALVAGTHSENFPYFETAPWDNGLLLVGNEGYHFTQRTQGKYLTIAVDPQQATQTGRISYRGPMIRASDNEEVEVEVNLPVQAVRFQAHQLGKPYKLFNELVQEIGSCDGLDLDWVLGMRWQPFQLGSATEAGSITIGQNRFRVDGIQGELEEGRTTNMRGDAFAFAYDYVALSRPGSDGYGFVDFESHALDAHGLLGKSLDWYARTTASASLTLNQNEDVPGNLFGVRRPSQSDASVVLFENSVDLGLAVLQRQMIKTTDDEGAALYGLREIFTKK